MVVAYAGVKFKTYSGLLFSYEVRKGRNGEYTKELWIDRREKSKSLAWSSVLLALKNIKKVGEVVDRPKSRRRRSMVSSLRSWRWTAVSAMSSRAVCTMNEGCLSSDGNVIRYV